MPAKGTTKISEATKQAVIAARALGHSNAKIAAQLNIHPVSVSKIFGEFRRDVAPMLDDLGDWKRDLKILAVKAVRRGLTDQSDNFKAGSIGVQTLRGLGELEPATEIKIQALIASVPEGHRARYLSLDTTDAIEVEGGDGTMTTEENNSEN